MSYNIHLSPEEYERLMAKRRSERTAGRPPYMRIIDDTRRDLEPVSKKAVATFAKGTRSILTPSVLGLLGTPKHYAPRNPRKPPIVGRHGTMNKTEAKFLSDVLHGEGRFEAVTLKLEGGSRYTPDFVTREDGVTVFYEIKGAFRLGSEGRAHTAFYEAASQFPWCRFVWAVLRKGGKWDLKTLDPVV